MMKTLPRSLRTSLEWMQSAQSPIVIALILASCSPARSPLLYKRELQFVHKDEFAVVGIEARTSNAREMTAEGVIGKQWARLTRDNLLQLIPHKADSNIIALYTDYDTDEHGAYTYTLGAKVSSVSDFPPGMVVRQVPAARYAVFTSEQGPATRVVFETWRKVWAQPPTPDYRRSYRADFELYDQRASDPKNAVVDLYVGVK